MCAEFSVLKLQTLCEFLVHHFEAWKLDADVQSELSKLILPRAVANSPLLSSPLNGKAVLPHRSISPPAPIYDSDGWVPSRAQQRFGTILPHTYPNGYRGTYLSGGAKLEATRSNLGEEDPRIAVNLGELRPPLENWLRRSNSRLANEAPLQCESAPSAQKTNQ
ncbi:hypothetical protein CC2G_011289 [Coprinopsis cinerea AmutBmut pab1-1]|nr:hypothetical protein CC2G_011289 [Coprinopsis cinerea AmutBmut pab1-1]